MPGGFGGGQLKVVMEGQEVVAPKVNCGIVLSRRFLYFSGFSIGSGMTAG
jgi:hypothetical protein